MLQISVIHEEKDRVISGLKRRGLKNAEELIQQALEIDQNRRNTQTKLDQLLNEANQLSRQIGQLMREGKKDEAEAFKKKTAEIKSETNGNCLPFLTWHLAACSISSMS